MKTNLEHQNNRKSGVVESKKLNDTASILKGNIKKLHEETKKMLIELEEMKAQLHVYVGSISSNSMSENKNNITIEYGVIDSVLRTVSAKIISREPIIITSNDGDDKVIINPQRPRYTFKYIDHRGRPGAITANIEALSQSSMIADVYYNINKLTNKNVVARLITTSDVTIIQPSNGNNTYTFTENGEFTFKIQNESGDTQELKAKVSWIDRVEPNGTVSYDIVTKTNADVKATCTTDKDVTFIGSDGTYVFTENGVYEFRFIDEAGNEGSAIASVGWIDKEPPIATISFSTLDKTNQDVIATINSSENIININSNGTHTFTSNGHFSFEFVDEVGNIGKVIASVDWIDKTAPVGTVGYDVSTPTSDNVTATCSADKKVVFLNSDGMYEFTENGVYQFEFQDEYGNIGYAVANVDWIDKEPPIGTVSYDTNTVTNENVIATVSVNEDVTFIGSDGTYEFTDNGSYEFKFTDKAGNLGTALAEVTWIDRTPPVITVTYNIDTLTNQNVSAYATADKPVVFENLENSYTFAENGTFTFKAIDEAGNVSTSVASVDWIDKVAPIGVVSYSTETTTSGSVVATVTADKTVYFLVGDGEYTFTENGSYTFEFVDDAGNQGSVTATVNWIEPTV